MRYSSVAPLLAVLLGWVMAPAPSAERTSTGLSTASDELPRLVAAAPDQQQVAEAGNSPELGPGRVTAAPRTAVPNGAARMPVTLGRARPVPVGGASDTPDHIPLSFRSRPPPL